MLSHSGLETLKTCPRKFQIDKCQDPNKERIESVNSKVHKAFGHAFGAGVQTFFVTNDRDKALFAAFMAWDTDLFHCIEKSNKSIWNCLFAIERFISMRTDGFLAEWDVLYSPDGVPATELGFTIDLMNGFHYRGFLDLAIRNRDTGAIAVLELKSTSLRNAAPATYKNSGQALGYSVVLDKVAPGVSSYEVFYLVYKTGLCDFEFLTFPKTKLQRARWIQSILFDCEMLQMYESHNLFPKNGSSCVYQFGEACYHIDTCGMDDEYLIIEASEEINQKVLDKEAKAEYTYKLTLTEVVQAQMSMLSESR